MLKRFLSLQWKSMIRSSSFRTEIWFKILMVFGALYFIAVFLSLGFGSYFIIEKLDMGDPFRVVNRFMIYYLGFDMVFRYMLQKMPVTNIKPLLYLPVKKNQVVRFSLFKTVVSFFNWSHAFFFIPFTIILITKDYDLVGALAWHLGMMGLIYSNNMLNVLVNNRDWAFYIMASLFAGAALVQYYQIFDITVYTQTFFDLLYDQPVWAAVPWAVLIILYLSSFYYFKSRMYLDGGLAVKQKEAKTENLDWLNRYGYLGTFLKNDIKLIRRNKRSKTSVITSFFFLFYGLLFFTGAVEMYDNAFWKIFAGIFVTGGFLFTFGQYVPSWDSSYYPLMMSQNIKYRDYLNSKWYLIIIATLISTVLSTFYIYFGWEAYAAVLAGAMYNLGINSYLVLLGGAYVKSPIDLTSNKKAFGDKQAFNAKTMLLTIPKMFLPMLIYWGGSMINEPAGYLAVAAVGVLGFVFKNPTFRLIERIYKKEKYKTLLAYKENA
ncbi:DUF5687 family protein [Aureicoccus marinus]|uniref:Uncharacterized protein n=1 Tax=Aureicoccus marinus TaxID=754435 RepID=A0A2S7T9T0_9FLAO|nr:DUF5687 family protein [Aureicoccus marinus]PQJ16226.1 hypothetical protein BST99_11270 [Aureicoccus marinus]